MPGRVMLFNNLEFLYAFLPVTYFVFWRLTGKMPRYVWLTVTGYVFYSFWNYRFCALMLFSTLVCYLAGRGFLRWQDPTHRPAFTAASFHCFGENNYSHYTTAQFRVVRVRLKCLMEEEFWPWPVRVWGRVVQWFLDRHPTVGERFLCDLIGGIDEMHLTLAAVKSQGTA